MSPEDQKELEELYDMCQHAGWQVFLKDLEIHKETLNDAATIRDEKDLFQRQGRLEIITNMLNLEDFVRSMLDGGEEDETL